MALHFGLGGPGQGGLPRGREALGRQARRRRATRLHAGPQLLPPAPRMGQGQAVEEGGWEVRGSLVQGKTVGTAMMRDVFGAPLLAPSQSRVETQR